VFKKLDNPVYTACCSGYRYTVTTFVIKGKYRHVDHAPKVCCMLTFACYLGPRPRGGFGL